MNRAIPRVLASAFALSLATPACRSTPAVPAHTDVTSADGNREIRFQGDFHAPIGVQLYTFREQAKTDPSSMLRMVRHMGITHVETAGTYGLSADGFAAALRAADLRATSMHVSYEDLTRHPDSVIAHARTLGAKYVGLAWYPHTGAFTEADARRAIADFNRIGRTMRDAGLTFFYHNHGYEPVPFGSGTLLDLIIRETDPALVSFEMDVLWTFLPNVDPAALIRRYPGRFRLMHIKDMRPGVPRGSLSGGLPAEQQAAIGEGQVNWRDVMAAAEKDGLEYYYIEDETPAPVANVPRSISYLERLRY